jgi:hypothetical protein
MRNDEPRIKTWRDDRNSKANNTDFNSGTRSNRASTREMAGMKALARPLIFEAPPSDDQAIGRYDAPNLPNNLPAEHR